MITYFSKTGGQKEKTAKKGAEKIKKGS